MSHKLQITIPSQERMYRAITERDARFDGRFYYGVLTTRRILPALVRSALSEARERAILCGSSGRRGRRFSSLQALPSPTP